MPFDNCKYTLSYRNYTDGLSIQESDLLTDFAKWSPNFVPTLSSPRLIKLVITNCVIISGLDTLLTLHPEMTDIHFSNCVIPDMGCFKNYRLRELILLNSNPVTK